MKHPTTTEEFNIAPNPEIAQLQRNIQTIPREAFLVPQITPSQAAINEVNKLRKARETQAVLVQLYGSKVLNEY
jgi:hypothetical protein